MDNKAISNLKSIHDYISIDSPTYAHLFTKSLVKATAKLELLPYCGRIVPELDGYNFREVIYQNYRIVYRVISDESIEILCIYHSARDFKQSFKQDWEL